MRKLLLNLLPIFAIALTAAAQNSMSPEKVASMKADLTGQIDSMKKQAQVMVDNVFSFGELGFQEFETSKYLTTLLEKEGFKIERGVAGIPTAFVATWGQGKPVIALGSDIDDIPQASQKPGIPYHSPMIEGAPGHGEGHNSGMPLNIVAALAVKKVMEREHLSGTLKLWPGVAEELLGTKAFYVRAGLFKDVDIVLFAHVGDNFRVTSRARQIGNRFGVDRIHLQRRDRPRRRSPLARPQRARRRGAHGRRLEFPPRTHPHRQPRPLRNHQRRRPAECGSLQRLGLVLLPRSRLPARNGFVENRRRHGESRGVDDQHHRDLAPAGFRLARPLQRAYRRGHVREHDQGRVSRNGPSKIRP